MNYIFLALGIILITVGIDALKRKAVKFFGVLDIVLGACWILLAIFKLPPWLGVIPFVVYLASTVYSEKKYKER